MSGYPPLPEEGQDWCTSFDTDPFEPAYEQQAQGSAEKSSLAQASHIDPEILEIEKFKEFKAQFAKQQREMALQAEQTRTIMQQMQQQSHNLLEMQQQNKYLMQRMMGHAQHPGTQAAPVSGFLVPTSAPLAPSSAPLAPVSAPRAPVSAPRAPVSAPRAPVSAPRAPVSAPRAPVFPSPGRFAAPAPYARLPPGLYLNAPPIQVTDRAAPAPLHPPPGKATTKAKGRAPSAKAKAAATKAAATKAAKAAAAKGNAVGRSGQVPIVPSSFGQAPVAPSPSVPVPVMPSPTVPLLHNPHRIPHQQRVDLATTQVAAGLYPDENDGIGRVGQMVDPHPYKGWHASRPTRLYAVEPKPPVMSNKGAHAQPRHLPIRPDFGNLGNWYAEMDAAITVMDDTRVLLSQDGQPPVGDERNVKNEYRKILWLLPTEEEYGVIRREHLPHVGARIENARNARAAYTALTKDETGQNQNMDLSGDLLDICNDMAAADQVQQVFLEHHRGQQQ